MTPLTFGEYRLVALVARGLSRIEIAEATETHVSYVRNTLREIYRKLGIEGDHKRIELARWHQAHQVKDWYEFEIRQHLESVWELVKPPVKFPAPSRRRREDREIPKAA